MIDQILCYSFTGSHGEVIEFSIAGCPDDEGPLAKCTVKKGDIIKSTLKFKSSKFMFHHTFTFGSSQY